MSKHKHHIIPRYICKELGIDPDFDENIVEVDRLDHARIHWGYKCDDLEPLFEYVTPAQWIIDLIPRGDSRDIWAAQLLAEGEIDGIDTSGENHSQWKGGITYDKKSYMKEYKQTPKYKAYQKERRESPEYKAYTKAWNQSPEGKAYKKAWNKSPKGKASSKERRESPERKAYQKAYQQTPKYKAYSKAYQKAYSKAYQQTPEYKSYQKEYYARKKAEAQS